MNSKDYTVEQCHAWAPHDIDIDKWYQPFRTGYTVVVQEKGTIVGFAHSTADGHYDYLFVHKDFQGLGIAKRLTDRIEDYAKKMDCVEITAHVSITARPFFERRGYSVERENTVERSGIQLLNYTMKKTIAAHQAEPRHRDAFCVELMRNIHLALHLFMLP